MLVIFLFFNLSPKLSLAPHFLASMTAFPAKGYPPSDTRADSLEATSPTTSGGKGEEPAQYISFLIHNLVDKFWSKAGYIRFSLSTRMVACPNFAPS